MPQGEADPGTEAGPGTVSARQQGVGADFEVTQLSFDAGNSDRFVYTRFFVPFSTGGIALGFAGQALQPAKQPTKKEEKEQRAAAKLAKAPSAAGQLARPPATKSLEELGAEFDSPFGLLFLDRTRIRPAQAVLGEELLSFSLGPGEQVVLEQKSFSQRETSFEEQNETTTEQSLELGSTLTEAMEQGLIQQQNESKGTNWGVKGEASGEVLGVNLSVAPSYSQSVTQANATTETASLKRTTQTTQKITSKYRSMHKTTLRVATQQQSTTSSQRTLRNPNAFTPIDLRYYKVYQELELCHERYGVRIAWAPGIIRPGAALLNRARAAFENVIQTAKTTVSLPSKPAPPKPAKETVGESKLEKISGGSEILGAQLGGESTDITLKVPLPAAAAGGGEQYAWDGDKLFIEQNVAVTVIKGAESFDCYVLGAAMEASGAVAVTIHVSWEKSGEVSIQAKARFVEADATKQWEYQQAYSTYQEQVALNLAQAELNARGEAEEAKQRVLEASEPIAECFTQLIAKDVLTKQFSDTELEAWLELWRSLFDWDAAGLTLLPGWWGLALADPDSPVDAFVNAVSARLYLPMRPGLELLAAELVAKAEGLSSPTQEVEELIKEVAEFRVKNFGGPAELKVAEDHEGECAEVGEAFICMGTWREILPTEGTHLEVVQASTAAVDDVNQLRLADDTARRQAEAALIDGEGALQGAIEESIPSAPVTVAVGIRTSERLSAANERTATTDLGPPEG